MGMYMMSDSRRGGSWNGILNTVNRVGGAGAATIPKRKGCANCLWADADTHTHACRHTHAGPYERARARDPYPPVAFSLRALKRGVTRETK